MTVRNLEPGKWEADLRPNGTNGKRYRKIFKTKAEGLRWEAWIKTNKTKNPDWEPEPKEKRRLGDLIKEWHESHGQHLKDGKGRLLMLNNLAERLGNPPAAKLKAEDWTDYRNSRIKTGVSTNTVNHEQAYLNAVFCELERLGKWKEGNPLKPVKKLKMDEIELRYLTQTEIKELLEKLKAHKSDAYQIAKLCLYTGTRWSEAEKITQDQIKANGIRLERTKNGKGRFIPLTEETLNSLPKSKGRLFKDSYKTFQRAIKNCNFTLPDGQLTHVLRHTFASHFIMNGGNILVLQKILGHSSLNLTMRYAHLAPEHLEEATRFNPLANMDT